MVSINNYLVCGTYKSLFYTAAVFQDNNILKLHTMFQLLQNIVKLLVLDDEK